MPEILLEELKRWLAVVFGLMTIAGVLPPLYAAVYAVDQALFPITGLMARWVYGVVAGVALVLIFFIVKSDMGKMTKGFLVGIIISLVVSVAVVLLAGNKLNTDKMALIVWFTILCCEFLFWLGYRILGQKRIIGWVMNAGLIGISLQITGQCAKRLGFRSLPNFVGFLFPQTSFGKFCFLVVFAVSIIAYTIVGHSDFFDMDFKDEVKALSASFLPFLGGFAFPGAIKDTNSMFLYSAVFAIIIGGGNAWNFFIEQVKPLIESRR